MKSVSKPAATVLSEKLRRPHWTAIVLAICGLLAYTGTLLGGIEIWSSSPDEQHGFLVIPIALVLLYLRRDRFPAESIGLDLRGLALIAVAAGMRLYGERYIRPWLDLWSLPFWIGGVVWLLGGLRVFRWAAPAIGFLVFMAPLPGQVQTAAGFPLQLIAASGGGILLQIFGQPAFVSGTTLLLGDNVLEVERACSGLRMFQGMLAVAVAWSLFSNYRWPRFVLTVAIAPLIAIFVNIVRIAVTGFLYQYVSGEAARAFSHDWAGVLMIPMGVLIFFLIDSVSDRLARWNGGQADRWLMTGSAAIVMLLVVGGTAYALHGRQQQRSVVAVLSQAREMAISEDAETLARASDFYRRYLGIYPDDAEVLAEMADLHERMGREHWSRAARLYELAWKADPQREREAAESLYLLEATGTAQRVWDRSGEMIPRLAGEPKIAAMRIRNRAIGRLTAAGAVGVDIGKMVSASREAIREDPADIRHTWQLARLLRQRPGLSREEDRRPEPVGAGAGSSPEIDDTQLLDQLSEPRRSLELPEADAIALGVIDAAIARSPDHPRGWLYRATLLQGIRAGLASDATSSEVISDAIDAAIAAAVERLQPTYPLEGELPPLVDFPPLGSDEAAPMHPREADEPRRMAQSDAAAVYFLAGSRALYRQDLEQAAQLLDRSRELNPRNSQVYSLLAETIPSEQTQKRIELFEAGYENSGGLELAIVFPLVEAYIAEGREEKAAEALEPIRELLPNLPGVAQGRIELLEGASRAGGLARQNRLSEAADLLAETLRRDAVVAHRAGYADLYARANIRLGGFLRGLGDDAAAASAFQAGGELGGGDADWLLEAAAAAETSGNLAAAADFLQRASQQLGEQRPEVLLGLARVRLAQQRQGPANARDTEELRRLIRSAADRGADEVAVANLLAETFVVEGNLDRAAELLEDRLQESPGVPTWRFSLALIRQLAGDVSEALAEADRYGETGAEESQVLLLKVLILERSGRHPEAAALVEESQGLGEAERRAARTQLVLGRFRADAPEDALDALRELASDYPQDLNVQRIAASVFAELRQPEDLKATEERLRGIEGERGTQWRAIRAARRLREAEDEASLREVETLVAELERLAPQWSQTKFLRGQLADRQGRPADALSAYETAWTSGMRTVELAGRILAALNRTGQADRSADYIGQLEDLVPRSTTLFDQTMPQYVLGDRSRYVLDLARNWAADDPSPENLVRLGQTLMTIAGTGRSAQVFDNRDPDSDVVADQADQAFARAIEQDPGNLEAWIGAFRVQLGLRGDREAAVDHLRRMSRQLEIAALDRHFSLAQLFRSVGEDARAGEQFEAALTHLEDARPESRQAVRMAAARFFAERNVKRGIEICRDALDDFPDSALAKTYLVGMLAESGTLAGVNEALSIQESIRRPGGEDEADPTLNRLRARLLIARAEILERPGESQDEAAAARDRDQAIRLLDRIAPRDAADATLLGSLYASRGRVSDAFNAFRESLRLEAPTAERLVRFLEFWNENYAAEGRYEPVATRYADELRAIPGTAGVWLRLSLRKAEIQSHRDGDPETEETRASRETAQTQAIDRYLRDVMPSPDGEGYADALLGLLSGLTAAGLADQIPAAMDQVESRDGTHPAWLDALALSLIRGATDADIAQRLSSRIERQLGEDVDRSPVSLAFVADALYVAGKLDVAIQTFRRSLDLDANQPSAVNNLAMALAERGDAPDEAMRLADRAIEMEPQNIDRRDTKLVVTMLNEDWSAAEEAAAALSDHYDPLALLHRSYLAARQGRTEEARLLFRRSRDAGVESRLLAPCDRDFFRFLLDLSDATVSSEIGSSARSTGNRRPTG